MKSKILFLGDIVGKPGRQAVKRFLAENDKSYDLVIANVENASHGFGLTKNNHDELASYGIEAMTSGNHIWDKKEVFSYIDESNFLIRPYNYHKSVQGVGYRIVKDKYIIINLMGKTFMPPIDCPFVALENLINKLKEDNCFENKIIFVDFHAEATAEKQCFAHFAFDMGVTCVVGTHTHVQTSDARIINSKNAYITDVGSCASLAGIIGMKYDTSLKRLVTSINERFDVEDNYPYCINAVEIDFEDNNAININTINIEYDGPKEDGSES